MKDLDGCEGPKLMPGKPSAWVESPQIADGDAPPALHLRRSRKAPSGDDPTLSAPVSFPFTLSDLGTLRRYVADAATTAALEQTRCEDLVLAVDELATNSICHGGGSGR